MAPSIAMTTPPKAPMDVSLLPPTFSSQCETSLNLSMGYNFTTSPQHKALLRRIESGFPKEHFGGDLLCHIFQPKDIQSDYPINLW